MAKDSDLRKVSATFSIPKAIHKAMEEHGDPSEIATQIFVENWERISGGDVSRALEGRKKYLLEEVRTGFKENKEIITKSGEIKETIGDIVKDLDSMILRINTSNEKSKTLKIELIELINILRKEKEEYLRIVDDKFNDILRKKIEEYELP